MRTIGCINLLRGCLIFFIFVMKDSTLEKVVYDNKNVIVKNMISYQIGKLSLCGLQLSYLRQARQETSKATTVTTDSAYYRFCIPGMLAV